MEIKNNKLIVVLGMHRSGTSTITRGLQVMGVGLGDRLMPPLEAINKKGFWEDIDFNKLNIEMLNALGIDWHYLAPIEQGDVDALGNKGFFIKAIDLLRQKVGDLPTFGFKDPRVAKLLPFWKQVFNHCKFDVTYILVMRHPLSVAKSLAKRDGFDAEKSYLLWLGHVITSLAGSTAAKRVLVDYDRLLQSPDRELIRIAKCTGLEIDPTELQNYKTGFLDEGLRHTIYDLDDLLGDDNCPPIMREVYAALLDVASEKTRIDDLALQNEVERWVGEFECLKKPLELADRLWTQKMVLTQGLAERDGQIAELTQQLKEVQAQIAQITSSNSWRITLPLREAKRWLTSPSEQAKRYLRGVAKLGKARSRDNACK